MIIINGNLTKKLLAPYVNWQLAKVSCRQFRSVMQFIPNWHVQYLFLERVHLLLCVLLSGYEISNSGYDFCISNPLTNCYHAVEQKYPSKIWLLILIPKRYLYLFIVKSVIRIETRLHTLLSFDFVYSPEQYWICYIGSVILGMGRRIT